MDVARGDKCYVARKQLYLFVVIRINDAALLNKNKFIFAIGMGVRRAPNPTKDSPLTGLSVVSPIKEIVTPGRLH